MSIAAKRALAAERRKKKDPNEPNLWRLLFGKRKKAEGPMQAQQTKKGKPKGRVAAAKDLNSKKAALAVVHEKDYYMSGALPAGAEISRTDPAVGQLVRTKGKSRYMPVSLNQLIGPDAPPPKLLLRSESADIQARRASLLRPQIQRYLSSSQPERIAKRIPVNEDIKYNIGFTLIYDPTKLMEYLIAIQCWSGRIAEHLLVGAIQMMDLSIIVLKKPLIILAYESEDIETRNLIGGKAIIDQTREATAKKLDMRKCKEGTLQVKFPGVQELRWMPCRALFLLLDPMKKSPTW